MSPPLISVVMPTHGGPFVSAAVASVVAQTWTDWELVIVDDGSRDGTARVIASLAATDRRIRIVTHERNSGMPAARNGGLRAISAGSTYVTVLDHDDVWMPSTLDLLRAELCARPSAPAVHGVTINIDAEGRTLSIDAEPPWVRMGVAGGRLIPWPVDRPTEFANFAYETCALLGSALVRRSALERVGGFFDVRADQADDYDLWIRLSRLGPIGYIDCIVHGYRVHPNQCSRRPPPPRGWGMPYVKYKMITSPDNTPEQRRLAIAGFRIRQKRLLREQWASLQSAWKGREYAALPRHLAEAAARVAAYGRGRPWSWHR
jgi:glycosyltransferase involved in cell wall biosynthesis